jgi:CheY-like chemotaxis protein
MPRSFFSDMIVCLPTLYGILLVEDSESDAQLVQRALRGAGVVNPVHHASNGADAVAFLNTKEKSHNGDPEPLGIVLLDLKLPDKSGFDILKLMQGRKAFDNTLRVVISQIEHMEHIKKAYSFGADTFITKPITQADLMEVLRSFPENWCLVDGPTPGAQTLVPKSAIRVSASSDPYDKLVHVWAKHRHLIETLRKNLERLRNQLSDSEETFAIIETLKEDLRNNYKRDAGPDVRVKKKRSSGF